MLKDLTNSLSIIEEEAALGKFSIETKEKVDNLIEEIVEVVKSLKEL